MGSARADIPAGGAQSPRAAGFPAAVPRYLLLAAAVAGALIAVSDWRIAAVLPFGIVAALICFLAPGTTYLLFLWLLPFSLEVLLGGGMKIEFPSEALVPVLAGCIVLRGLLRDRLSAPGSRLYLPIAAFALYMALSFPASRFPIVTLKAVVRDWTHILGGFALALFLLRTRGDFRRVVSGALAASIGVVLFGMFTQVREGVRMYQEIARPFFQTHSIYGTYVAFAVAAAMAVIFSVRTWRLRLSLLYLPLMMLAVGLSFVRGAWMGIAASAVFYLWVFRSRVPRVLLAVAVVAACAAPVAVAATGLGPLFLERIENFLDPSYTTNFDRIDRWNAAFAIWKDHPLFGTGWGTYGDEYFGYVHDRRSYASLFRMGAHNLHLEHMADGGLIALLLFLWILAEYAREAWRVARKVWDDPLCRTMVVASCGALVSYLTHAQVNNLGPSDKVSILFWFLLAMIPLAERYWDQAKGTDEQAPPNPSR